MKRSNKNLKQPTRYTHQFITQKSQDCSQQQQQSSQNQVHSKVAATKHKIIQKQKYVRKVISKPNEPSAIRLEQINQTFNNLSCKSSAFIEDLQIDHALLNSLKEMKDKFTCECNKRVKFYCLKCNKKCGLLDVDLVKLPLQVHVIHHLSEKINKSSVAPMRFLSESIKFYPFMSRQSDHHQWNRSQVFDKLPAVQSNTYILYPHKKSKSISQIQTPIQNIIILDCTWFQTDQIIDSLHSIGYQNYINLQGYQSIFWRYNHHGAQALSSAESIMYFLREFQKGRGVEVKEYDSIMLLYALNMEMVGRSIQ